MKKITTIAVNIIVVAFVCLVLIWANTYYRQRAQFQKGEAALKSGDYIAAIAGYESAIHMYTPGSSLVDESAQKLWAIGTAFERGGDLRRALIAYRSLRSSFYAARGLYTPGQQWIARCDRKIAELLDAETKSGPHRP
jgi:tetratricopeptide (TPR) repeat protein